MKLFGHDPAPDLNMLKVESGFRNTGLTTIRKVNRNWVQICEIIRCNKNNMNLPLKTKPVKVVVVATVNTFSRGGHHLFKITHILCLDWNFFVLHFYI